MTGLGTLLGICGVVGYDMFVTIGCNATESQAFGAARSSSVCVPNRFRGSMMWCVRLLVRSNI